ncbi:MAG TPA: hypothetical protein VKT29_18355 [Terriglobales bacterium]|nr:hypothetical protein [Terriglobales bacterium]
MPQKERIRQPISGSIDMGSLQTLREQGWALVALEWEREVSDEEATKHLAAEVPFGLQVATGTGALEENSEETDTLLEMLELMIEEGPYWRVAEELNRRGHRTRRGAKWSPVSVFEMLPRLIEVSPRIFSSDDWHKRRQSSKAV